jgi:hypothetical protein
MRAMDAIRVRDDLQVTLKRVLPEEGPHELKINKLFSSPGFATKPNNHCAPLLDVIELQNPEPQELMVFPLLNQPKIQTFGEFVDFFTQICQVRPKSSPLLLLFRRWFLRAFDLCISEMSPTGGNHTFNRVCLQSE